MPETTTVTVPKLLDLRTCVAKGIYPNLGGLRALVFYADKNGFHKVIKRINRKIFIDVPAFYEWVEAINQNTKKGGF